MHRFIRLILSGRAPARRLAALLLASVLAAMAHAAPAHVIIRTAAGVAAPGSLAPLLADGLQSGDIVSVLFLTGGRPEKPGHPAAFGSLAILDFANDASAEAWLRAAAPRLPAGLIIRRADTRAQRDAPRPDSEHALFLVNTYIPLVSADRFSAYVQGYVKPLYDAMCDTGHLVRYTIYHERGEIGRAEVLNVLEYRDETALAAMGKRKASLRAQVAASTPTYAGFDKIKDQLRIDGFGTLATGTEPSIARTRAQ